MIEALISRLDSRLMQPTLSELSQVPGVDRNKFGSGKSGERSYSAVISATEIILKKKQGFELTELEEGVAKMDACSYPNPNSEVRCNAIPNGTVNYDILGEEEMVLVCSREHGDFVEKKIEEELRIEGRSTWPARNGWGRA